jgi:predicted acyl esterase
VLNQLRQENEKWPKCKTTTTLSKFSLKLSSLEIKRSSEDESAEWVSSPSLPSTQIKIGQKSF